MRNRSHDQPKPLSLLSSLRPPEECPAQPNLNSAGWRWCVPARLKSAKAFATKASGLREFRSSWMSAPRTLHGVQLKWSGRRPRTQKKAISLPRKNYLNSANDAPSTIYIYISWFYHRLLEQVGWSPMNRYISSNNDLRTEFIRSKNNNIQYS